MLLTILLFYLKLCTFSRAEKPIIFNTNSDPILLKYSGFTRDDLITKVSASLSSSLATIFQRNFGVCVIPDTSVSIVILLGNYQLPITNYRCHNY
ncbi:hypothetical protein [Microseira sp. BLCC-F43]|uniref:hypothetical protein n=1 Tax=Microseira sp. BLCC-F43 TaxID=3153602 RepID=UPI0035B7E23F